MHKSLKIASRPPRESFQTSHYIDTLNKWVSIRIKGRFPMEVVRNQVNCVIRESERNFRLTKLG